MTQGFELSQGEQTGTININSRQLDFEISFNDVANLYKIDFYENGTLLFGGRFLVNGGDLLYNHKSLKLGSSLKYIGNNDLSEGYLLYE